MKCTPHVYLAANVECQDCRGHPPALPTITIQTLPITPCSMWIGMQRKLIVSGEVRACPLKPNGKKPRAALRTNEPIPGGINLIVTLRIIQAVSAIQPR